VAELLPKLHAVMTSLGAQFSGKDTTLSPDLDARFELFSHLRELLGERDPYWLEFDHIDEDQGMTGSLADDLTDIYCELKHGLRSCAVQPERAVQGWLKGYECHWGKHLLDAQRHLLALGSQGQLS
jgi:hypothetical protein